MIEWDFSAKQLNYFKRLGSLKKVSEIKILTTSYLFCSWGKRTKYYHTMSVTNQYGMNLKLSLSKQEGNYHILKTGEESCK